MLNSVDGRSPSPIFPIRIWRRCRRCIGANCSNKRITGYINWQRKRRFVHERGVLDRLIADLKAQAPDHIAMTGDLTNIALREEFVRGRAWLESLGAAQDVSVIPGNHDVYVPEGEGFARQQWGPYMAGDDGAPGFPYLRRRGPLALIGLSSGIATAPFMATGRNRRAAAGGARRPARCDEEGRPLPRGDGASSAGEPSQAAQAPARCRRAQSK